MMQFQNQFAAVEMATPLERMGSWKISPMMTQPAGPQVLAGLLARVNCEGKEWLDRYSRREEKDEQADEDDQHVARRARVFRRRADDGDDELGDGHADGTPDEQWATAELFDGVEGDGRGADVDDCCDHGDQEGILQADGLEEGRVVVCAQVGYHSSFPCGSRMTYRR